MASLENISWMCMNWNESSLNRKNIALNLREKGKYGFSFEDKSSTVIAIHFCKNENKEIHSDMRIQMELIITFHSFQAMH